MLPSIQQKKSSYETYGVPTYSSYEHDDPIERADRVSLYLAPNDASDIGIYLLPEQRLQLLEQRSKLKQEETVKNTQQIVSPQSQPQVCPTH